MGFIQADLLLHILRVWTWARTGKAVLDLGGSVLDIRFIIIKSYLMAIWGTNARGFICKFAQSMEMGISTYRNMGG